MYKDNDYYSLELGKHTNYTNSNLEFYGKLLAEINFHSNPTIRAEIGFKKKF